MRLYAAWAGRHRPYSYIVDFGSIPLSLGFVYLLMNWLFGTHWAIIVTAAGGAYLLIVVAAGLYIRRRRGRLLTP